jgi:hypothetical protein
MNRRRLSCYRWAPRLSWAACMFAVGLFGILAYVFHRARWNDAWILVFFVCAVAGGAGAFWCWRALRWRGRRHARMGRRIGGD